MRLSSSSELPPLSWIPFLRILRKGFDIGKSVGLRILNRAQMHLELEDRLKELLGLTLWLAQRCVRLLSDLSCRFKLSDPTKQIAQDKILIKGVLTQHVFVLSERYRLGLYRQDRE